MHKEKLISHILNKKINFWDLVPEFVNIKDLSRIVKELQKDGLIEVKKSVICLTKKGKDFAKQNNLRYLPTLNNQHDIKIDKKVLTKFKKLRQAVPRRLEYDQIQLTEESVLRKVEIMRRRGDLAGKDIVCVGDDDMMAIALALTGLPKSIVVVDIDQKILDYENKILKKFGYPPNCKSLNLIDGTPEEVLGKFDVFITEPSDTLKCMKIFFSRGCQMLRDGGVAYLGVPYIYFSPQEIAQVQKYVLDANGYLTDVLHQFYCYRVEKNKDISWVEGLPGAVVSPVDPWLYTCLFRIKFAGQPKPLLEGKVDPKDLMVGSYHLE